MQTHIAETRDRGRLDQGTVPRAAATISTSTIITGCAASARCSATASGWATTSCSACTRADAAIAHCPTSNFFLGSGVFDIARAVRADRPVRVGLGTDIGAGTSFSILADAQRGLQSRAAQPPVPVGRPRLLSRDARLGAALHLDDKVGSIAPGMEADLVVLDMRSTPLIDFRMDEARDFAEQLFIQMILGDDRAVQATYVAGRLAYDR